MPLLYKTKPSFEIYIEIICNIIIYIIPSTTPMSTLFFKIYLPCVIYLTTLKGSKDAVSFPSKQVCYLGDVLSHLHDIKMKPFLIF